MSNVQIFEIPELFTEVQMKRVFPDGKTFVDCLPKETLEEITKKFSLEKAKPGFSIKRFVSENFELPAALANGYKSDRAKTVEENIESLWEFLSRQPDMAGGSLIPLPFPYIVPGGRFGEIYYWDSYFTMLGLKASGKDEMVESMIRNFSFLLDSIGHIPNGNRTYYLSRSQPPFYSLMVRLLADIKGKDILLHYLPQLEKEYSYWMKGFAQLTDADPAALHVVRMPGREIMNRYWDESDTPRPEAYREDVEIAHQSKDQTKMIFHHLRAGAESGWDFSSRWFRDGNSLATIHTSDIVPVDLNCLLFHMEETIAEAYQLKGDMTAQNEYAKLAAQRKDAIRKYCWNEKLNFFVDYDLQADQMKSFRTLGGVYPLFFKLATQDQADQVAAILENNFLAAGGLLTTLKETGQQWDAPNGWAPLQWMAITGLENYGHHSLAGKIAERWINLNKRVFERTGKLMEKYNVVDTQLEAGGGEYTGQDGFGWTNGVLLALIKKYPGYSTSSSKKL